jgi:hypothetical protein
MRRGTPRIVGVGAALVPLLWAGPLAAQGYRVRLDTRFQSVSYEGLAYDSLLRTDVTGGTTAGFVTPDGYAAFCAPGATYCSYYRPGGSLAASPIAETVDAGLWGFGVPGLQVRLTARAVSDLGAAPWPGTEPAAQLLEGYAQYDNPTLSAELGRTHEITRFGWVGFDGGKVEVRPFGRTLRMFGYGGAGLAGTFPLPVTSAQFNPLADTLPPDERQIVLGGGAELFVPNAFQARLVYQRQYRSAFDTTVSERVAGDWNIQASPTISIRGGADYDLAQARWGKADLALNYVAPSQRAQFTLGGRRYRPYFDLYTIWAVFNPTPYSAADASASWTVVNGVELRGSGEYYHYDNTNTSTPLVSTRDDGWRANLGASYLRLKNWAFDVSYDRDVGPGASSQGVSGTVTYRPVEKLLVSVDGGHMQRPLEYRYDDSHFWSYGLRLDYQAAPGLRLTADALGYSEDRQRPDTGQFQLNQLSVNLGATLVFGSGSDSRRVNPAILRIPDVRRPQ